MKITLQDLRNAFVTGAKWWEWKKENATMWQSDQLLAEAESERRYSNQIPTDNTINHFSCDNEGQITFNGIPYLNYNYGTTETRLERARQIAVWLNECLEREVNDDQRDALRRAVEAVAMEKFGSISVDGVAVAIERLRDKISANHQAE